MFYFSTLFSTHVAAVRVSVLALETLTSAVRRKEKKVLISNKLQKELQIREVLTE